MLDLKDTDIKIGSWLYLRFEDGSVEKGLFIGLRPGRYIVISIPSSLFNKLSKKPAENLTAYFNNSEGKVYEFCTSIIKLLSDPIELLLLRYPEKVILKDQRSYKRIKCFVAARIQYRVENGTEVVEGIVRDISKKGCRIIFRQSRGISFKINERIIIMLKFPGIPGEQKIIGSVRNIIQEKTQLSVGIEFDEFAWWAPPY